MSKEKVEEFLAIGYEDRQFRIKYDNILKMDEFVKVANEDGFDFTIEELKAILLENGDSFDSYGNPPKKGIWTD